LELVGRIAVLGAIGMQKALWWDNLKEGDHLEDLGINGRAILKRILQKWGDLAQDRISGEFLSTG
jgi:hypothetical protein